MWGIDEGLPQNSVLAIVQTPDGFLWFGTYGGLARFDGVKVNVYNRSNTTAMLSDRILCLLVDREGTLWIGTENGGVMTFRDGVFSVFTKNNGLADNAVSTIVEDSSGRIWFSHEKNTLSKYENGTFTTYSFDDSVSSNYYIAVSDKGNLLYISNQKMFSYESGAFHYSPSPFIHADLNISNKPVWDRRGNCWITTSRGLYKFPSGDMRKPYKEEGAFTSKYFYSMLVDSKNNLWVATKKDFCRYDSASSTSFSDIDIMLRNKIIVLFEDREENLWLGTNTGGLIRLRKIPFTVFSVHKSGAVNNITSITQLKNGAITYGLNCSGFGVIINDTINAVHSLRDEINNCVWSLFESSQGIFWMGTWGGGLYQCRLNERSALVSIAKETHIPSVTVIAIYEDRKKTMWFGTYNDGLFQLRNDSVARYSIANGLCDNDVRTILEDRHGDLWIGTSNGLSKFSEHKFTTYTTSNGLSINAIRTLYEDADGVLWIGTYGGGLNRFENGKFFSITTKEGLFDNLVSHILEDDSGYFWMGCNRGIFRVAKQELNDIAHGKRTTVSSVAFGKDHGLLNVETNGGFQPNALKTSDGRLWFPTVEGVACIHPEDVKLNTTIIPVVIEKIYVDQQEIAISQSLSIGPEQHTIVITYTAPSFIESKKVQFKYQLIGYDEQWIDAATRREAYYT